MSQSIDLPKVDTLAQELATIQQTGAKRIALLGSRHVPLTHQHLIEMMSYALVLSGNRLITSGATGTNSAAIRGAMRADSHPKRKPPMPPKLSLAEASALCNQEIVSRCQQLVCFAFHDSLTLLRTCQEAEDQRKVVTLFYFD